MRRIRRPISLALVVTALFGGPLGLADTHPDTPAAVLPETPAPYGLGGAVLQADADGIEAIFARMPREVAGKVNER